MVCFLSLLIIQKWIIVYFYTWVRYLITDFSEFQMLKFSLF